MPFRPRTVLLRHPGLVVALVAGALCPACRPDPGAKQAPPGARDASVRSTLDPLADGSVSTEELEKALPRLADAALLELASALGDGVGRVQEDIEGLVGELAGLTPGDVLSGRNAELKRQISRAGQEQLELRAKLAVVVEELEARGLPAARVYRKLPRAHAGG